MAFSHPLRLLVLTSALFAGSLAHAVTLTFSAALSGSAESPANVSPGVGTVLVTYDDVTHLMRIQGAFSGLTGNTTAAHIHAATAVAGTGTAGVATQTPSFVGFPLGGTSGSFDLTLDLGLASSFSTAFVTANGATVAMAEAALMAAINSGKAYFNIHTSTFGGGEIRGFLAPTVPDGGMTAALLSFAVVGLAAVRRRLGPAGV